MKKFRLIRLLKYRTWKTLLVSVAIAFGLYLAWKLLGEGGAGTSISRAWELMANGAFDYLFVLGATLIFIRLIKAGRWVSAAVTLLIGILWVLFDSSLTFWLYGLGADSLSEAQHFDWQEALFFFQTLPDVLIPYLPTRRLVVYIFLSTLTFSALWQFRRVFHVGEGPFIRVNYALGFLLILVSLVIVTTNTMKSYVSNSELYAQVSSNFSHAPVAMDFPNQLKLVVYIGESTSSMNMGVYGYFRDTTPNLSRLLREDSGLLVFDNVMSTFTMTSLSLLEGLSVGITDDEEVLPITSRHRISLLDVLSDSGVPTLVLSNQGQAGTWNMASSIILKKSQSIFSVSSGRFGNVDWIADRPFDHDFFGPGLDHLLDDLPANESAVIFLHSYAGHGAENGYYYSIPQEFRHVVDPSLRSMTYAQVSGRLFDVLRQIEEYDSAIKYVDFSLTRTLERVRDLSEPCVFIYFSDHGESPYTNRGHEPSRFMHEMARVPFIMYFNDRARRKYGRLFDRYRTLARGGAIATLAQVPRTIVDLFGGDSQSSALKMTPLLGEVWKDQVPPILIRSTSSGDTYVNLNNSDYSGRRNTVAGQPANVTDNATRLFVASKTKLLQATSLCYSKIGSIASAVRGAFVTDCLALRAVFGDTGNRGMSEVGTTDTGLELSSIFEIAKRRQVALWLDFGADSIGDACKALAEELTESGVLKQRILVNFEEEMFRDPDFPVCATSLRQKGVHTSLALSSNRLSSCDPALARHAERVKHQCGEVVRFLGVVGASGLISDLVFDYRELGAIENVSLASSFTWNLYGVDVKMLEDIRPGFFGMLRVDARDVNQN